jgi:putative transposase
MGLHQKALKFKLKPNAAQAAQIQRTFGSARFVFNHFLARRSNAFKLEGKHLGYCATSLELTALKRDAEWLQEVDKFALQNSLKDLDKAFANFFKDCKKPKQQRRFSYPKFKKKATASSVRCCGRSWLGLVTTKPICECNRVI